MTKGAVRISNPMMRVEIASSSSAASMASSPRARIAAVMRLMTSRR